MKGKHLSVQESQSFFFFQSFQNSIKQKLSKFLHMKCFSSLPHIYLCTSWHIANLPPKNIKLANSSLKSMFPGNQWLFAYGCFLCYGNKKRTGWKQEVKCCHVFWTMHFVLFLLGLCCEGNADVRLGHSFLSKQNTV